MCQRALSCRIRLVLSMGMLLLLSGCGGQQISSTAQDRSLVSGADAGMAGESEGIVPESASMGEEDLPSDSETTPESSSAMAAVSEPAPESGAESVPESVPEPVPEAVTEPEVAGVPEEESSTEAMPVSPTESTESESMASAETPDSTPDSPTDMSSPSEEEPEMVAGLVPEEPMSSAPSEPSTPPAAVAAAAMPSITLEDIYFDFDRFALRGDARQVLEANASQLKGQDGWNLTIEGHCDERGTEAYNLVLGERRANTVKQYLQELGVSVADVKIISYGKERPFCTDHNDECWQSNRRAHFILK